MQYLPIYTVRLVKDTNTLPQPSKKCNTPADAAEIVREMFRDVPYEMMIVIMLASSSKCVGVSIVSVGILNSALVHPREVFQRAIEKPTSQIILVHNHPSGNGEPSAEDIQITRQVMDAGKILGIPLIDHLIIAGESTTSFAERGLL